MNNVEVEMEGFKKDGADRILRQFITGPASASGAINRINAEQGENVSLIVGYRTIDGFLTAGYIKKVGEELNPMFIDSLGNLLVSAVWGLTEEGLNEAYHRKIIDIDTLLNLVKARK